MPARSEQVLHNRGSSPLRRHQAHPGAQGRPHQRPLHQGLDRRRAKEKEDQEGRAR